jgi:flagellar protein FlaH
MEVYALASRYTEKGGFEDNKRKVLSTGIEELDNKIGGGIPVPSMILLEGSHGTGKTVLSFLIVSTLLRQGFRVLYITTETTVKELIHKASSAGFRILRGKFISGSLAVFSVHIAGAKWDEKLGKVSLRVLSRFFGSYSDKFDAMVIDSLSILVTYSSRDSIMDFLTFLRSETSLGKTFIISIHPGALEESLILRLRASSDIYLYLDRVDFGGKVYKAIQVKKIYGIEMPAESSIVFDIDPSIGFRIIPISLSTL